MIERRKDIWTADQIKVLEDHGRRFLNFRGREGDALLKPMIDAAGPPRSLQAIQLMRSKLGITEAMEARLQRLRKAARSIDHEKQRQIPSDMTWEQLSPIARSVLLGSLLGDGGVYEANGTHYYSETHKSAHKDYLIWKAQLLPREFHGCLRERNPQCDDARCVWETGVSQIFTFLRKQFYTDAKRGFKTTISEWAINQVDLITLLIWLLDDGRNNSKSNGFPNLEIAVPRWNPKHVIRACKRLNEKYGLHLYLSSGMRRLGVNNIIIPARDRDALLPQWWQFSDVYKVPECLHYKIPRYNPTKNGRRRLHWEETFGTDVHGLRTVVLHSERVALAKIAFTMQQIGFPCGL